MILVDANLLLYARIVEFPQHERAIAWLDAQLAGDAPVGLPAASLLAFVRIASNPKLFERPLAVADGVRQVRRWLGARAAWTPQVTPRHWEIMSGFADQLPARSLKWVTDMHLAALSLEHGLTLCSADRGFRRFPGLRWENPLA